MRKRASATPLDACRMQPVCSGVMSNLAALSPGPQVVWTHGGNGVGFTRSSSLTILYSQMPPYTPSFVCTAQVSEWVRPMAHDLSSPPKFLVRETGISNFARVPRILVPDFSGTTTRNLGGVGQCSIRHQKLGGTWLKCSAVIGRRDLHARYIVHALHRMQINSA